MDVGQITQQLRQEAAVVDTALASCLEGFAVPPGLRASMQYSLAAGGKRFRPVLCLVWARRFGLETRRALPFAVAVECIHTYSLIHDDLPAMDNDDLRRGVPSNHKKFNEATAILAGDGLLTDAFALLAAAEGVPAERSLAAVRVIAEAAGSAGMVGGQFLDMEYTDQSGVSLEQLAAMHAMKTGALIRAACLCGAIVAGAPASALEAVETYGRALGAAFQIADDILDVTGTEEELGKPAGSDAAAHKATYVTILGLAQSRILAQGKAHEAASALAGPESPETAFLRGLALYTVNRVS